MLKVAVPEVTLYRLPFSVPLVPDSVKPSGSDKGEGAKEANSNEESFRGVGVTPVREGIDPFLKDTN